MYLRQWIALVILVVFLAALFYQLYHHGKSMKRKRPHLWGIIVVASVLGWFIIGSFSRLIEVYHHKGPGYVGEKVVSESEYKRSKYFRYGVTLFLGVSLWILIPMYYVTIPEGERERDTDRYPGD